ncbi:hypothetical protein DQ237_14170 [Blastococcus sp. TF02-8]|uniref:hypothetical protein n=1 Tax=Blastococcus sp. TF02-8 TaxID=2250574 RepID=UPI000DE9296A|nr:hypothetical protein [Blastococcus sp. TF02-8]RBY95654.1 hypothetical protein DQ237_14170 [Blastococcus sp. TF02-8]
MSDADQGPVLAEESAPAAPPMPGPPPSSPTAPTWQQPPQQWGAPPPHWGLARPAVPPQQWSSTPQWQQPQQWAPPPAHWTPPPVRPTGTVTEKVLAVLFGLAWLTCPVIEPMPADDMAYPLWQAPIDIAAVVSIVAAGVALWRGNRHAAWLSVTAGVLMAVETVVCVLAGHTPVGWWTWVQSGLSLFVLAGGVGLHARPPAPGPR